MVVKRDTLKSIKDIISRMTKKPNKDQRTALVEALKAYGKSTSSN